MDMQLNIKSEEAYALASELAALTGESLTGVVVHALRDRLEREKKLRDREQRKQRVRAIAAEIRSHLEHPLPGSDHSWLYDENGLPR
jgi:antitoxin VapB